MSSWLLRCLNESSITLDLDLLCATIYRKQNQLFIDAVCTTRTHGRRTDRLVCFPRVYFPRAKFTRDVSPR